MLQKLALVLSYKNLPTRTFSLLFFLLLLNMPYLWAMMVPQRSTVSFLPLVELIDHLTIAWPSASWFPLLPVYSPQLSFKVCFIVVFVLQMIETALESLNGLSGIIQQVVELQPNAHLLGFLRQSLDM